MADEFRYSDKLCNLCEEAVPLSAEVVESHRKLSLPWGS